MFYHDWAGDRHLNFHGYLVILSLVSRGKKLEQQLCSDGVKRNVAQLIYNSEVDLQPLLFKSVESAILPSSQELVG